MYKISDVIQQFIEDKVLTKEKQMSLEEFLSLISQLLRNARKTNEQQPNRYVFDIDNITEYVEKIYYQTYFVQFVRTCIQHGSKDISNKKYIMEVLAPRFKVDPDIAVDLVLQEIQKKIDTEFGSMSNEIKNKTTKLQNKSKEEIYEVLTQIIQDNLKQKKSPEEILHTCQIGFHEVYDEEMEKYINYCIFKYYFDNKLFFSLEEPKFDETIVPDSEIQDSNESISSQQYNKWYEQVLNFLTRYNCKTFEELDGYMARMQELFDIPKETLDEIADKAFYEKRILDTNLLSGRNIDYIAKKELEDFEGTVSDKKEDIQVITFQHWVRQNIGTVSDEQLEKLALEVSKKLKMDFDLANEILDEQFSLYYDLYDQIKQDVDASLSLVDIKEIYEEYAIRNGMSKEWVLSIYIKQRAPEILDTMDCQSLEQEFTSLLLDKMIQSHGPIHIKAIISSCAEICHLDRKTAESMAIHYLDELDQLEEFIKTGHSVEELQKKYHYTSKEIGFVLDHQISSHLDASLQAEDLRIPSEFDMVPMNKVIPIMGSHSFKMKMEYVSELHRQYLKQRIARNEEKIDSYEDKGANIFKQNEKTPKIYQQLNALTEEQKCLEYLKGEYPELASSFEDLEQKLCLKFNSVIGIEQAIKTDSNFQFVKENKYAKVERLINQVKQDKEQLLKSQANAQNRLQTKMNHLRVYPAFGESSKEYEQKMTELQDIVIQALQEPAQKDDYDGTFRFSPELEKQINERRKELYQIQQKNKLSYRIVKKVPWVGKIVKCVQKGIYNIKENISPQIDDLNEKVPVNSSPELTHLLNQTEEAYRTIQQNPEMANQYMNYINQMNRSVLENQGKGKTK